MSSIGFELGFRARGTTVIRHDACTLDYQKPGHYEKYALLSTVIPEGNGHKCGVSPKNPMRHQLVCGNSPHLVLYIVERFQFGRGANLVSYRSPRHASVVGWRFRRPFSRSFQVVKRSRVNS